MKYALESVPFGRYAHPTRSLSSHRRPKRRAGTAYSWDHAGFVGGIPVEDAP
jgi:hypothetical protein